MARRSVLLVLVLALALSCGGAMAQEDELPKIGVLTFNNLSADELNAKWIKLLAEVGAEFTLEYVYYDTLSSMLLALEADQIDAFGVPPEVANYIIAGNDELTTTLIPPMQEALSFALLDDKAELLTLLNDAIAALKADGTIDALVETHIEAASPKAAPPAVDMPTIAGADTIMVAITGDLPPIDYTTADGKPAGFNVALLAAISEKAGINIELIPIDSGARVIALTSGKADAVFWMRSVLLPDGTVDTSDDTPPGVSLTDYYYANNTSVVTKK